MSKNLCDIATENPADAVPTSSLRPLGGPTARTRVTNGAVAIGGVDGRTLWARRYKDVVALHASDLGGADLMSEAQKALVRRAATLVVELERLEARFASGDKPPSERELDLYSRLAGGLRRLLETIGLERRPRDTTPTITAYLRAQT